jgi:transposase
MALKSCFECGREVSTLASRCPHCGAPYPADLLGSCGATMSSCGCLVLLLAMLPLLLGLCVGVG